MDKLEGEAALITGSARNIVRATTLEFACEGAKRCRHCIGKSDEEGGRYSNEAIGNNRRSRRYVHIIVYKRVHHWLNTTHQWRQGTLPAIEFHDLDSVL